LLARLLFVTHQDLPRAGFLAVGLPADRPRLKRAMTAQVQGAFTGLLGCPVVANRNSVSQILDVPCALMS
jgi:hypothetical protein